MLNVAITSFSYPNASEKLILEDVSFSLAKGEHLVILGESGCGKSTLLHLIYGLESMKDSEISWNGTRLLGPTFSLIPGEPFMKLVSQHFDLMPYISVAENIAAHLSRNDKESDNKRVDELLAVVELTVFKNTKAQYLSGGQKQRVAIAKALAKAPEVLLLDEPFSSIDGFLKNKLRRNVFAYLKKEKITCITATHNSEEALSFANTILMLKEGKMEFIGTPANLYNGVLSSYQAGFFGDFSVVESSFFLEKEEETPIVLLPHQLKVSGEKTPLIVTIKNIEFKGSHYLIIATHKEKPLFFKHKEALKIGATIYLKRA